MKAADRATFVVDPQGIIRAIEVTAEGIGRDASDLLRKVKAAQYVASHPRSLPGEMERRRSDAGSIFRPVGKI